MRKRQEGDKRRVLVTPVQASVAQMYDHIAPMLTSLTAELNGLALAKAVQELRPDVAILLTSGTLKVPLSDLSDQFSFFSKPYEIGRVINHIKEHLMQ